MPNNGNWNENHDAEKVLRVKMLGDFVLEYGDQYLSGHKGRSKQVWNLLEYLLIHRSKEISPEKLMDALWEEDVENPANALKNLVYRLRSMLAETLLLPRDDYVIFKHGTYAWNNSLPMTLDIEQFESAWKRAQNPELDSDARISSYLEAISLYKGDFLTHSAYKEWVVPLTVYYQRIYMECVASACNLLFEKREFKKVEDLCLNAIEIDPLIEKNHEFLIMALIESNNNHKALTHYEYVTDLFYREVGVKPSEAITRLYKVIVNKDHTIEKNIEIVKTDLREAESITGAVYCDYEVFKLIYRLYARAASRSGKSVFIALLTIGKQGGAEFNPRELNEFMDRMKGIIISALRKDDVVTRFSRTQFLLLLSNINYENTELVLVKLLERINRSFAYKKISVTADRQPLEPVELSTLQQLRQKGGRVS